MNFQIIVWTLLVFGAGTMLYIAALALKEVGRVICREAYPYVEYVWNKLVHAR